MDERSVTDEPDPQAAGDRRRCARHLLQHPMTCAEHDPELFRLIRRHEMQLDQWFTQRLGYRLHIGADTARLFKIGTVPDRRPLRTKSGRPFLPREYTMLALVLAATAAGPDVISLRDLVAEVRSAAAEADVALAGDGPERRAFVNVLSWMMAQGMVRELFEHIDAYVNDGDADAVLKLRPDRIVLAAVPAPMGALDPDALVDQATRRGQTRQWMRCRLAEDPVLYRTDLTDAEWGELRRRLGAEEHILDEMFGLVLESRAEGVAAVDASGDLADVEFPAGGTIGHASLLLIDALLDDGASDTHRVGSGHGDAVGEWSTLSETGDEGDGDADTERAADAGAADDPAWVSLATVIELLEGPIATNANRWSNELVENPDRLVKQVVRLLTDVRLGEQDDRSRFRLLPGATRFAVMSRDDSGAGPGGAAPRDATEQDALW